MTLNDKLEIKAHLVGELEIKIKTLKAQIENLTIDAQNDAKGSAGDKHETGLAMMHLEQEKLSAKLSQTMQQLKNVVSITTIAPHYAITFGSLVNTGTSIFFVSDALPHFNYQGKMILPLSTQAPIYIELKNKKAGDVLIFNGKTIKVLDVV
jgi:hypothetical protein